MQSRILRINEVARITCLSKSQIYRMIACGAFPKSVVLSVGRVGWLESDIERWIKDRVGDR